MSAYLSLTSLLPLWFISAPLAFCSLKSFCRLLRLARILINPRCICEDYGSCFVCVCVSVRLLSSYIAATYLVYQSEVRCHKIPYGVPNPCIVWILPTLLFSQVLASFTDSKLLYLTLCINRMLSRGPTLVEISYTLG